MPDGGESYNLNSMDMHNRNEDYEYDQEDALLQDEEEPIQRKRIPKNSDRTLILLGIAGSVVITGLILLLIYGLFGVRESNQSPFDKTLAVPVFGDIGCVFPGEAISPVLEQKLTLLQDTLEIVTTGKAVGDIIFHTELEDELEYVRLDVKLQGPSKDDLHSVYTRVREGRYELQSPEVPAGCMRFTLEVWLPRKLVSLSIKTETLTHLTFDDINLNSYIGDLDLKIGGDDMNNLVYLPEARIQNAKYTMNSGFLAGTTMLYNSLLAETGTAQIDAEIVLMKDLKNKATQYHDITFNTKTRGLARTKIKNPMQYTFMARHKSEAETQMVLLYPELFAGELSMATKHLEVRKSEVEVPVDGIVHVGARGTIKSDLRVRNDYGTVYLSFDQ